MKGITANEKLMIWKKTDAKIKTRALHMGKTNHIRNLTI